MADAPFPLSPGQALVHAGQTLAPGVPAWNMGWRFDIDGPLDPDRFDAALRRVAETRDALRLRLGTARGEPVQWLDPVAEACETVDLSGLPDPEAEAEARTDALVRAPFDLAQATWRAALFHLGPARWSWVFVQHHIATDATSGKAILDALAAAYAGEALASLPPLADLAARRASAAAAAHWAAIAHARPAQGVPYGGRRDPAAPASAATDTGFGPARSAALDALADRPPFRSLSPDLSRFALFATIHAAWLHRATGDTELALGVPVHMRGPAERAVPGLLMETLPLPVSLDADTSFRDLHSRILAETLTLVRHAQPGAITPEAAQAIRSTVNYLPFAITDFAGMPARARWLHAGAHDPAHDLQLTITRLDGRDAPYRVEARANRAAFGPHLPALAGHWLALADALLADPATRIGHVALGGEVLRGAALPPPATVLARFAAMVRDRPDAPAAEEPGRSLTYRDFDARVGAWAEGCRAAGLRPGEPVLIQASRSAEMLAMFWGAMRAGGMAVPMPADTPAGRLDAIVARHGIRLACLGPGLTAPCTAITPRPAAAPFPLPDRGDPAYAIFTSGSTGEPKGVVVDHGGLADYADWAGRMHPGTHAFHSSIGFDLTITAMVVPLSTGHSVAIHPETGTPDLAVRDAFREDRSDVVKLTPAHLSLVLEDAPEITRISRLILGGEALTTASAERARALSPSGLSVTNEYGPTEAVVGCMLHEARDEPAATVSIGRAADGVTIAVLDAGLNPVPPGIPGEIHIGGRLAAGYLGRPDLTAERFHDWRGMRLYRTGDLARIEADGTVTYLGRADSQVKLSGVRIEPAEIAAVVERVPGVRRAHAGLLPPAPPYDMDAPACTRCGLSAQVPGADLAKGICATCREFETLKDRAGAYFDTPEALRLRVAGLRGERRGRFDAIMLLSGGKDSTYALHRLAELTPDILCLTLDNGFLSDAAKENIRAVAESLRLEHRFMSTPAMPAIFRDSLARHSNVCQGCFKTIYTLALRIAREEGIPAIVTGLSRGQFFETRLTPDLFAANAPRREEIEAVVLEARRAYHRVDDAVARHLDTSDLADPAVFNEVGFIDIYRYLDVPVAEIYRYLAEKGWRRPPDTGRSTNCRINDLGIHVHTTREGWHNYAIPYAWDVRMGVKTRTEAMAELRDALEPARIAALMAEIGLDPGEVAPRKAELAAWVEGDADMAEMRAALRAALPREMVPARIVPVDRIPLTANGKVHAARLPHPGSPRAEGDFVPPAEGDETLLAKILADVLGLPRVSATENFYDIGGDSIAAIRIATRANEAGLALSATDIFRHQSIRAIVTNRPDRMAPAAEDAPLLTLDASDLAALGAALDP